MRTSAKFVIVAAVAFASTHISQCKEVVATEAPSHWIDACQDRCELWGSTYGIPWCGSDVTSDYETLISCLYSLDNYCLPGGIPSEKPTEAEPAAPTEAEPEEPEPEEPEPEEPEPEEPEPEEPEPEEPEPEEPEPEEPEPEEPEPEEPEPEEPEPEEPEPEEPEPEEPEPEEPDTGDSEEEDTERPTGPLGPNGECVYRWREGFTYAAGRYTGLNNVVYQTQNGASGTDIPGQSSNWVKVAECTGDQPQQRSTSEAASMVTNANMPELVLDKWDADLPTVSEGLAIEKEWTDDNLVKMLKRAGRTLSIGEIEAIEPGRSGNPENVRRVESIVSESKWNYFFPVRHISYTYTNWLRAVGAFPEYCQTYDDGRDSDLICRKVLAATFAHFGQETGMNTNGIQAGQVGTDNYNAEGVAQWGTTPLPTVRQGLYFLREIGFSPDTTSSGYESCSIPNNLPWAAYFPCPGNVTYYGRGAKQLSYNYNYGPFSKQLYGDEMILLNNPDWVASTWLNLASAVWFAVTPQSPKPSMIWALDGTWVPNSVDNSSNIVPGFGATIEIINGGLECSMTSQAANNRVEYFKQFAEDLGFDASVAEPLTCSQHKGGFQSGSSAAVSGYLDKQWDNNYPKCQRVSWQTQFYVVNDGDYKRCIDFHFRSQVMYKGNPIIVNGATV